MINTWIIAFSKDVLKKNFGEIQAMSIEEAHKVNPILYPNCSEFAIRFDLEELDEGDINKIETAVEEFKTAKYDVKEYFNDGEACELDIFSSIVELDSGKKFLEVSGNTGDHGEFFTKWMANNGIGESEESEHEMGTYELCIEPKDDEQFRILIEKIETLRGMCEDGFKGIEMDILTTKAGITEDELRTDDIYFDESKFGIFMEGVSEGLLRKYLKYAVPFYEDLKITKVNGG